MGWVLGRGEERQLGLGVFATPHQQLTGVMLGAAAAPREPWACLAS